MDCKRVTLSPVRVLCGDFPDHMTHVSICCHDLCCQGHRRGPLIHILHRNHHRLRITTRLLLQCYFVFYMVISDLRFLIFCRISPKYWWTFHYKLEKTLTMPPKATKSKKAIFRAKVKVKVTRSLTLVSFERASLVEYACHI